MTLDETKEWDRERKVSLEVPKRREAKCARRGTEESLGEVWVGNEESKVL